MWFDYCFPSPCPGMGELLSGVCCDCWFILPQLSNALHGDRLTQSQTLDSLPGEPQVRAVASSTVHVQGTV